MAMRCVFLATSLLFSQISWSMPGNSNSMRMQAPVKTRAIEKKSLSKDEALMIELTGKDYTKISDKELYAEIFNAFKKNDELAIKSQSQYFLTRFPMSPYADNVLFLLGRHAQMNKNYAEALKSYQRLLSEYPNSNKVVSARLAKARVYQSLNLPDMARKSYADLRSRYPGSPEAFQAEADLKLMERR